MDTSDNMDSLDDTTALPELSFDDLLDPSPIKKNKSSFDDDPLEMESEAQKRKDDTLNTPGPKPKLATMQKPITTSTTAAVTIGSGTAKTFTPVRTQPVKLGHSPGNLNPNPPVLLNSKNVLPKTANQILNNSIKLTQKIVGGNPVTTSLAGKTAVRTSNGQIIYIQKSPAVQNIKTTSSPSTSNVVKTQTLVGNNSKPVTIQVLRTGVGGKNTTLTLSPTSLAGKKIITSSGNQVIIKGTIKASDVTSSGASTAKTITTNAITGLKTVVKPIISTQIGSEANKSKPIVVQGTNGKQIIVSNQNLAKLSPKTQQVTTTLTAGSSVNTSTSASGQMNTIQIGNKVGVQYIRVLSNTKNTSAAANSPTTNTKTLNTTNIPVKILNSLPQKFTVVQKTVNSPKLIVTQKKDSTTLTSGSNNEFAPMTSKVQKTIVTVPTIRSLNEDKNKHNTMQTSLGKPTTETQTNLLNNSNTSNPTSSNSNQMLIRKHKISEINSEIHRITVAPDSSGPPDIKKPAPNNRVVVVSGNTQQPKILNNSIQQPGRITSSIAINPKSSQASSNSSNSNSSGVSTMVRVTQNGKPLYTHLKPPTSELDAYTKPYSVLKTSNQTSTLGSSIATTKAGVYKPLINKQQLIQQQQLKLQQLKQQQQQQPTFSTASSSSQNTKILNSSSSSLSTTAVTKPSSALSTTTYLMPIKIKEEPNDNNSSSVPTSNTVTRISTVPPLAAEEDDVEAIDSMVGGVRRKHCNCSKSQCLKLYCDCFANGEFCQDCTCKDCFNNLENEDERQRAIKACLERNPNAFKPKITSSRDQSDMRLHNKGCNCKRSGCLKNYCECYEAKIPCSSNCKCVGCRNVEDRPDLDMDPIDPKIMATIAMGGAQNDNLNSKRSYDKSQRDLSALNNIKIEKSLKDSNKTLTGFDSITSGGGGALSPSLENQQCNFITQEVIDATIQCMITQADECEKNNLPAYQTEKMVMEELGRCLVEIIDFSIQNTDNSYTQD